MPTMKAAVQHRYGPPRDVVEVREVEVPMPTGDQVLVRVKAASVNRGDIDGIRPRWQFIRLFFGLRRPRNTRLGLDVAGVVEETGPDVTRFKVGDRLFGDLFAYGAGAFSELVCAPEKAFELIPEGVAFEDAATLPHAAVLAIQSLRSGRGEGSRTPKPGDDVLVVGASGNVGPFAVQIAKSMGARVTAVASGPKLDFVRSLGADAVVDYRTTDATRLGRQFDWIVDVDAHDSILRWRQTLKPGGVYVALGGPASWMLQTAVLALPVGRAGGRRMGLLLGWKPFHPPDVERLKTLLASGVIRPHIDRRYPLEQAVEAIALVDEGRATGKVVLVMDSGGLPPEGPSTA
jgi:NADPH:quinone reductase-like Zn-dependent oxidoreductase